MELTLKKKDAGLLVFEAKDVLARVQKMGDLFEPVQTLKQKLPQLSGLLGGSSTGSSSKKEQKEPKGIAIAARAETATKLKKVSPKKKGMVNTKSRATVSPKGKSAAEKRRKL